MLEVVLNLLEVLEGVRCVLWVLEVVLHMLEAVEGARGSGSYALLYARDRRRCALYAEVARLAKRFLPDGSDSRPSRQGFFGL